MRLEALMLLPWSIRVERDDSDGSFTAQVTEVPDAIATGATLKDLGQDLWEALSASLDIRLQNSDPIPLPAGAVLPWAENAPARPRIATHELIQQNEPVIIRPTATRATVAA